MAGVHRSHISSKRAKARGWSRIPPPEVRAETMSLGGINVSTSNYLANTGTPGLYFTGAETWGDVIYSSPDLTFARTSPITADDLINERQVTKMRALYRVYVVDPRKGGKVLLDGELVIANDEGEAKMKSTAAQVARGVGLELDQVDICAELVEKFIRPRKETQRVRIAKDEE